MRSHRKIWAKYLNEVEREVGGMWSERLYTGIVYDIWCVRGKP